jgi:hypothetical protein
VRNIITLADITNLSLPVLLRPAADSPQWDGLLQRGLPNEAPVSTLRYEVIRIWDIPTEQLLTGGVGTLALAPISKVSENEVRRVIRRMKERLSGPQAPRRAADVWAATYVLLGLRYSEQLAKALFEEVLGMEESVTYQAIVRKGREEGRVEEARRLLLVQGKSKFGPADATTRAAIERIDDLGRLEPLALRLINPGSWQELLPPELRRRRQGRRRSGS